MARPVSIRWSLLGSMSVLLVFLGGTIMAATFLGERQVVRALSRSLITQTIDQTVARLQRFVDPVTANLLLLRSWGDAGLLAGEAETLNRLLVPALRPYPQLSGSTCSSGSATGGAVARPSAMRGGLARAGSSGPTGNQRRSFPGTRSSTIPGPGLGT